MDKKVVRESYESCLTETARLSAYATSVPFLDASEVNQRQDILAVNDLVIFCIHARRLIENTGLKELASQTMINCLAGPAQSIWKIIGCVIHYQELEVFRSESRLKISKAFIEGVSQNEFWERAIPEIEKRPYADPIAPHILLKSDRSERMLISLCEMMQIFSEKIIPAVIKTALSKDLCLIEDFFKDLDMPKEKLSQILSKVDQA